MSQQRRRIFLVCAALGGAAALVIVMLLSLRAAHALVTTPSVENVVGDVLAARNKTILAEGDVPYGDDNVLNILVLGIDSRKEGNERHCDAIHMLSLNVETWDMTITSVPRGTYAPLPPGKTYAPNEYYLANACGYGGFDYGITQIERILGMKYDYLVTIGFSQALGVFRVLRLPTTDTLQWLRHRQSYAIGDPQRSHNQAIFIEDLLRHFGASGDTLSPTLLYVLYNFVDTDMDFGTVHALYNGYVASGKAREATSIVQSMLPFYATVDYHLDLENPDAQIAALLDRVRPYLSKDDLSDRPVSDVQAELIAYLTDALQQPEEAQHVVDEEMWLQVEDDATREALHFAFLEWYATALAQSDAIAAQGIVADYILEEQSIGSAEYEARGRQLLVNIVQ